MSRGNVEPEKEPVENGTPPKIIAFLCNWCSYVGADMAGTTRLKQPEGVEVILVPCTGRMDPLFPMKALVEGAEGVLVSGCHPGECHHQDGNLYARRRLEVLKGFLPFMGFEEERFSYTWISASEGKKWQQVVTKFTERIKSLNDKKA